MPDDPPLYAFRRGGAFVVPRRTFLPPHCVKCGASATRPWKKQFSWHAPWIYALIVFPGVWIYIIAAAMVRKTMELNLPLCDIHYADQRRNRILGGVMAYGFIPVSFALGMSTTENIAMVNAGVMLACALGFLYAASLGIHPSRIDKSAGTFKGACDAFLNLLPPEPEDLG